MCVCGGCWNTDNWDVWSKPGESPGINITKCSGGGGGGSYLLQCPLFITEKLQPGAAEWLVQGRPALSRTRANTRSYSPSICCKYPPRSSPNSQCHQLIAPPLMKFVAQRLFLGLAFSYTAITKLQGNLITWWLCCPLSCWATKPRGDITAERDSCFWSPLQLVVDRWILRLVSRLSGRWQGGSGNGAGRARKGLKQTLPR